MEWDFSQKRTLQLSIGIAVLTFMVYASSLTNAFVDFDDALLIYNNALVLRMSPYTLWRIFTSYDPELYIPLTLLLYQVQYLIAGPSSTVFHFTNLLLHIANTLLVVWVISMLAGKRWMGVFAGMLFAVHPIHTEAIAWAAATKDLLAACFFLLSIGFYMRFLTYEEKKNLHRSAIAFAMGLLSKVVILLLPFVLLLLDHHRGRGINRKTIGEKKIFFALSALFAVIAVVGKLGNPRMLSIFETVLMSGKSTVFYLQKLFIPTELSVLYPQDPSITFAHSEFIIAALLSVALMGLFLWSFRRAPRFCLGLGLFLLPLIPNFVNFSKNGYLFFASDRYVYLPSIGILYLAALLLERWVTTQKRAQCGAAISIIVIVVFAVSSNAHSRTWKNSESLYRNILQQYPHSTMAMNNLGSVLMAQDKHEEALTLFEQVFELEQRSMSAINIGLTYQRRGNIQEAQEWYEKSIDAIADDRMLSSGDLTPYYFLADLREKMGFLDEALALYQEAATRGEKFAEPSINLGIAYQKRQRLEEAADAFRHAIELSPHLPAPHYHLAGILAETGNLPEAEKELEEVLRINPQYESAERHLRNIREFMPSN